MAGQVLVTFRSEHLSSPSLPPKKKAEIQKSPKVERKWEGPTLRPPSPSVLAPVLRGPSPILRGSVLLSPVRWASPEDPPST